MPLGNSNTPNTETGAAVKKVYEGDDGGAQLGLTTTSKVGFYGAVPYAQKSATNQSLASAGLSSSASFFGAKSVNATSWTAQRCQTTALTAAQSSVAMGPAGAILLAECVDTLVGLGLWKGNS